MTDMRFLLEKYHNGDPITDDELKTGIEHFKMLSEYLRELGPVFELPAKELWSVVSHFHTLMMHRKVKDSCEFT